MISSFSSISYIFSNLFYYIEKILLRIADIMMGIFDVLSGNRVTGFNLPQNAAFNVVFGDSVISLAVWIISIIGIVILINTLIKKKRIIKTSGSILLSILIFTIVLTSSINVNNAIFNKVLSIFDEKSDTSVTISFNNDEYATMYRILVKVGNYSLSENSKDLYNINTCFNEIRPDLQLLEKNGFFNFDYVINGANSNWQEEISKIGRAAELSQDIKIDFENKELVNAISSCMDQIRTNGSFKPLKLFSCEREGISYNNSFISNLQLRNNNNEIDAFEIYDVILIVGLIIIIVQSLLILLNYSLKFINLFGLYSYSSNAARYSVKNERKKNVYITKLSIVILATIFTIIITKLYFSLVTFILGGTFENILISIFGPTRNAASIMHRSTKLLLIVLISLICSKALEKVSNFEYEKKNASSIKADLFGKFTIIDLFTIIVFIIVLFILICSTLKYKLIFIALHIILSICLLVKMHGNRNYLNIIYMARYYLNPKEYDRTNKDSELYGKKKRGQYSETINEIIDEKNYDRFNSQELYDIISYTGLNDSVISFNDEYYGSVVEFKYAENTTKHINIILKSLNVNQFVNVIRLKKSYFIAIFDKSIKDLGTLSYAVINELQEADSRPEILSGKWLAVLLRNLNLGESKSDSIERVSENDYGIWSMPHKLLFGVDGYKIDGRLVSIKRVKNYPGNILNSDWLTNILALSGEKIVVKIWPKAANKLNSYNKITEIIKDFSGNRFVFDTFITSLIDDYSDEKYGFEFDSLYYNQLEGFISSELSKYDKFLTYI